MTPLEGVTVTPQAPAQSAIQPTPTQAAPERPEAEGGAPEGAPTTPEAPKEELASSKFAALARREKAAQIRVQEAKELEAKIAAREAAIAEKEARLEAFEAKRKGAKLNPKAFLDESGLTYQEITEYFLNDEKPTVSAETASIREEMNAWKKEQEDRETKAAEDAAQAAREAADAQIAAYKVRLTEFVTTNADDYELINLHEQHDLVFETIQTHFEQSKKVLSNKEAADLVEKYLEEQIEKSVSTKKMQSRFGKKEEPTPERDAPKGSSTTLTNTLTSSAAPSMLSPKLENDRMARALARLNGG